MISNHRFLPILCVATSCLSWTTSSGPGVDDHRVELKIDNKSIVAPAGSVTRGMMSMVRHLDGTIFLNAQARSPKLYKSSDKGEAWSAIPVKLTSPHQVVQGLGVNRKGRLFLVHQTAGDHPPNVAKKLYGQDLFLSYSDDSGQTWKTSSTDFGRIPPAIPNMQFHEDGVRTFIEQPDATLMFTTTIVPSPAYAKKYGAFKGPYRRPNYSYKGTPLDFFSDVLIRSYDGGETWGDPSRVYPQLNPHESALAIDPLDGNHLLLMSRIQSAPGWHTKEEQEELMRKTGNPQPHYKQAALFESNDGGRTFHMPDGGFGDWYGHRGTINWFQSNVVVATHQWGGRGDTRKVARISLDGGKHWVDGTKSGTLLMSKSTKFVLDPKTSFSAPTVELSKDHFMSTVWRYVGNQGEIVGVFWHLERRGAN